MIINIVKKVNTHKFLIFLLAYNGKSFKWCPQSLRSIGLLAAHYLMSSPHGNVRIIIAKNTRNKSLKKFDHVKSRYTIACIRLVKVTVEGYVVFVWSSSTVSKF